MSRARKGERGLDRAKVNARDKRAHRQRLAARREPGKLEPSELIATVEGARVVVAIDLRDGGDPIYRHDMSLEQALEGVRNLRRACRQLEENHAPGGRDA